MFDFGILKSVTFSLPVISIGNLRVGGTGKTPHIEFFIHKYASRFQIATLSRGYGRHTKGFNFGNPKSTASTIGDEPMQFYKKFGDKIFVAVCEDRVAGVPQILEQKPDVSMILLDDAYQHRYINRDVNLLLTEFDRPFYNDLVLPAGRLRESIFHADRADVVVVTKCPDIILDEEKETIIKEIKKYIRPEVKVYFSHVRYTEFQFVRGELDTTKAITVSGIADSSKFLKKASKSYKLLKTIEFHDHHEYSEEDLYMILETFEKFKAENPVILTTEKDWVKLRAFDNHSDFKQLPFVYLPIEVVVDNEEEFLAFVDQKIKEKLDYSAS